jgi:glutaminyl-peptide cyclotransferase
VVHRVSLVGVAVLSAVLAACSAQPDTPTVAAPTRLHTEVLQVIPHDPAAFTEGLELAGGLLYEGTGIKGSSSIRIVDPATGVVKQKAALPGDLFGEGITVVGPNLWQLTYTEGVAIQRDRSTLKELNRVSYQGQGWGLCYDQANDRLIMSDGSDRLTFRDPRTFQPTGEVHVRADNGPVTQINELECAHDAVFANIWQTDTIVRINPASGRVGATIDAGGLLSSGERGGTDVLNGIAAIPDTDEFLVTGKYWPKMFRVRFVP